MVTVYTLTPAGAAQALQDNGLDALGITGLRLAPRWGGANPSFDAAALTITFTGVPNAPWRGVLEYLDSAAAFRDVAGTTRTILEAHRDLDARDDPELVAALDRLSRQVARFNERVRAFVGRADEGLARSAHLLAGVVSDLEQGPR